MAEFLILQQCCCGLPLEQRKLSQASAYPSTTGERVKTQHAMSRPRVSDAADCISNEFYILN